MAETHLGVESIAVIPDSVGVALRRTMVLGLPIDDADKPTFYFERQVSWADQDAEGNPWDWTSAPAADTTKAPVKPICAVEFFAPLGRAGSQFSDAGDFFPSTVVITMLEEDFLTVVDSSYVTIGPALTKWWFRYNRPALGLGGLSVYQATFQAEDTV